MGLILASFRLRLSSSNTSEQFQQWWGINTSERRVFEESSPITRGQDSRRSGCCRGACCYCVAVLSSPNEHRGLRLVLPQLRAAMNGIDSDSVPGTYIVYERKATGSYMPFTTIRHSGLSTAFFEARIASKNELAQKPLLLCYRIKQGICVPRSGYWYCTTTAITLLYVTPWIVLWKQICCGVTLYTTTLYPLFEKRKTEQGRG